MLPDVRPLREGDGQWEKGSCTFPPLTRITPWERAPTRHWGPLPPFKALLTALEGWRTRGLHELQASYS